MNLLMGVPCVFEAKEPASGVWSVAREHEANKARPT